MKLLLLVTFLVVLVGCCEGFFVVPSLRLLASSASRSAATPSCSRSRSSGTSPGRRGLRMYDEVGPQFAHKLVQEGYDYIDVRADYEFEHGRPAGAINIPAFFSTGQGMTVNPDFVKQVEEKFPDKESKLVLGCLMGSRSAQAAGWLEEAGYQALVNVEGGFSAWARDDSLPVEV